MKLRGESRVSIRVHTEPAIQWRDYDRIEPGVYRAYCRCAEYYRDPGLKRWTSLARFDVLSDGSVVLARVPWFLNLGEREKPHAGRRGKYLKEWVRANGEPPKRGDRLSPRVFGRRMARVEVGDTDPNRSPVPYSVVKKIIEWETGPLRGSLSHQVTQSRKAGVKPSRKAELSEVNGKTVSAQARVEGVNHSINTPEGRAFREIGAPVKGKIQGDAAD
jgi:hypothetical protein